MCLEVLLQTISTRVGRCRAWPGRSLAGLGRSRLGARRALCRSARVVATKPICAATPTLVSSPQIRADSDGARRNPCTGPRVQPNSERHLLRTKGRLPRTFARRTVQRPPHQTPQCQPDFLSDSARFRDSSVRRMGSSRRKTTHARAAWTLLHAGKAPRRWVTSAAHATVLRSSRPLAVPVHPMLDRVAINVSGLLVNMECGTSRACTPHTVSSDECDTRLPSRAVAESSFWLQTAVAVPSQRKLVADAGCLRNVLRVPIVALCCCFVDAKMMSGMWS